MKELNFEELTTRQKLGMVYTAILHGEISEDDEKFVLELIKDHSLGAVWIQQGYENTIPMLKKVREIADYPILIITDGESGVGKYRVGKHNAVGTTGSEKSAYIFGKTMGVAAREMGYNVVCNPVVDLKDGSMRCYGTDADKVTELAISQVRGMHDGGVLCVAKHYPGGNDVGDMDSHMAESVSDDTRESLFETHLKPYLGLNGEGLLDGIMVGHKKFINIDDKYPASLSKKVIDIIRDEGYAGIIITDALSMMSIKAMYGEMESKGLSVSAGVDLLLPYARPNMEQFGQCVEAYEKGLISDECLNEAVKRVLIAQHKVTLLPVDTELSDDDIEEFQSINKNGVYTRTDKDIPHTISRDGKHYFVIVSKQELSFENEKVDVDTFSNEGWFQPARIVKKINELFPNADYKIIHEFPSQLEMKRTLYDTLDCDKLVFITFSEMKAFCGREHLTRRLENLIEAMQITGRISSLIHLGNPHVLKNLPHIPNVIFGGQSTESVDATLEVLAGEYPAKGTATYDFKLK